MEIAVGDRGGGKRRRNEYTWVWVDLSEIYRGWVPRACFGLSRLQVTQDFARLGWLGQYPLQMDFVQRRGPPLMPQCHAPLDLTINLMPRPAGVSWLINGETTS